ncbi:MAG: hypothetical protein ACOX4T_09990 [Acetivibrionales bacterium]
MQTTFDDSRYGLPVELIFENVSTLEGAFKIQSESPRAVGFDAADASGDAHLKGQNGSPIAYNGEAEGTYLALNIAMMARRQRGNRGVRSMTVK